MESELEALMGIDMLLVFGGGKDLTEQRALQAAKFIHDTNYSGPITVTGKHSGLLLDQGETPSYVEANIMCEILLKEGVNRDRVIVEDKGLDGLSCLIYSAKKWAALGVEPSRVGFVCDTIAKTRVKLCGDYVLGDRVSLEPVASAAEDRGIMVIATNYAVQVALRHDLRMIKDSGVIEIGNPDSFDSYLETLFPFGPWCFDSETKTWNNLRLGQSWYGKGVIAKTSGIMRAVGWGRHYQRIDSK